MRRNPILPLLLALGTSPRGDLPVIQLVEP